MKNFTTRCGRFFYSYALDKNKEEELVFYLRFLEKTGIADLFENIYNKPDSKGGRPPYQPCDLFASVLYGFAFDRGSLRDLEDKCKYDLRYRFLMDQEEPSYATFSNFINTYILPFKDEIFFRISSALMDCFSLLPDDCFIDGTKIEADANKYKFVWKPTAWHLKLCDRIRALLEKYDLLRNVPSSGLIDSGLIARKLSELDRTDALKKDVEQMLDYLDKALEYEEKEKICGPYRKSYYKTDHDATAMCLKDDYYSGLGSNMHAAYNLQIMVSHGLVLSYYVSQSRNDILDFTDVLERFHRYCGTYPKAVCADAGYGSLENWKWLKEHGVENYVKYTSWEGNVSGRRPDLYVLKKDNILCLNGKAGYRKTIESRHPKRSGSVFYVVNDCAGCLFKPYCRRFMLDKDSNERIFEVSEEFIALKQESEKNLLSIRGIEMRVNRSSQVEGAFGVLKQDMNYTRLNRIGMENVRLEISLKLAGYNIRKLFHYHNQGQLPDCWKAPDGLKPEQFKKPSPKRLSKRALKSKNRSVNQEAKSSYKNIKKGTVKPL